MASLLDTFVKIDRHETYSGIVIPPNLDRAALSKRYDPAKDWNAGLEHVSKRLEELRPQLEKLAIGVERQGERLQKLGAHGSLKKNASPEVTDAAVADWSYVRAYEAIADGDVTEFEQAIDRLLALPSDVAAPHLKRLRSAASRSARMTAILDRVEKRKAQC